MMKRWTIFFVCAIAPWFAQAETAETFCTKNFEDTTLWYNTGEVEFNKQLFFSRGGTEKITEVFKEFARQYCVKHPGSGYHEAQVKYHIECKGETDYSWSRSVAETFFCHPGDQATF
ncbi:MAG: hypothetical protein ABL958_16730 [Bdellovibrionia bacterium]